ASPVPTKRELPTSKPVTSKGQAQPVQPGPVETPKQPGPVQTPKQPGPVQMPKSAAKPLPAEGSRTSSLAVMGRPPASGQAGFPKVPVPIKQCPNTPTKQAVKSQPTADDVTMASPPVPKASPKPSPAKDVHMSGSTPTPAKVGTPFKPGYTPVKSPDYKKARRALFEDAAEVPESSASKPDQLPGCLMIMHWVSAKYSQSQASPAGVQPIRRPDSLTTVARSTSTLVLGDFPREEEDPSTGVRRLIFEGYYGMPCQDKQWPPLEEAIRFQDASPMMSWIKDALPRHPQNGVVMEDDIRTDLLMDSDGLKYLMLLVNGAWTKVSEYEALKAKTAAVAEAVHNQAENMIQKLRQQLDNGELGEDLLHKRATATEQWRSKKSKEIQDHLERAELAALVAIDKSVDPLLGKWNLFNEFGWMQTTTIEEDIGEQLFMDELEEPSSLPLPETLVDTQGTGNQAMEGVVSQPMQAEATQGTRDQQEAMQQGPDSESGVPMQADANLAEATQGTRDQQEATQQAPNSESGVPMQADAEATQGTGDQQQEATQQAPGSESGVPMQADAEATQGTGDQQQEAMQQAPDSESGVPLQADAEATQGTGDQHEAVQQAPDLESGVPTMQADQATQGTGDQQQEAMQHPDPGVLQLAPVEARSKTSARTEAVFKALEKPNSFDLKDPSFAGKGASPEEASLTQKEGESTEEWMTRVAHNVFMKFHRSIRSTNCPPEVAEAASKATRGSKVLDDMFNEYLKAGGDWLSSSICCKAESTVEHIMRGEEHYMRLCDLRAKEGDQHAEEIYRSKMALQDALPEDSQEWTLVRTFKEAVLTKNDKSSKTTTLQTDQMQLDAGATRAAMTTMAHGLEIAMPGGSNAGSSSGFTRRPSSMALPLALGDQEAGSTLATQPETMDKKKKTALTNQCKNKIALASTKLEESSVLQEEIAGAKDMSQPIREGFLTDLKNHKESLQQARDKLQAEVDKGSGDRLQELLDEVTQKITNYVQSTNAMKKMSAGPKAKAKAKGRGGKKK
ncbi:unnamed protein product, partial [Symbiodinium sp. CCMP2592]